MKVLKPTIYLAACCLLALGCVKESSSQKKPRYVERLPRVEVTHPVAKTIRRKLNTSATVEALKKVDLTARVSGMVTDLDDKMDIGHLVRKDQELLRLDVPDLFADREVKMAMLEQAKKQQQAADAALAVAQREVEEGLADEKRFQAEVTFNRMRLARIKELVRQRAQDAQTEQEATRQTEAAEAALASNRASVTKRRAKVEQTKADLELARQRVRTAIAEIAKLDRTIEFATVTAPFDGVITRRWVDPGAVVKDNAPLLTLMQVDRVRVLVDIPQRDVPFINSREQNPNADGNGDRVLVRMPSIQGEIEGYITRLSRSLDPVTRTMRAEIELSNPGLKLHPGMFGSASVLVEERSDVLTVPASAIVRRGEGAIEVYRIVNMEPTGVERRGVLQRVAVELGLDDGKEVEVRGLNRDDWIVLRATGVMRSDEPVLAIPDRESLLSK